MKQGLLALFLGIAFSLHSQSINRIAIEHIGEIDKPFQIIEVSPLKGPVTPDERGYPKIVIVDKAAFSKVTEYLNGAVIGITSSQTPDYGTFQVSFFYGVHTLHKTIVLNKEGSVYLLINLQNFLSEKTHLPELQSTVRRLL